MAKVHLAGPLNNWFVQHYSDHFEYEFYDYGFDEYHELVAGHIETLAANELIEPLDDFYRAGSGVVRTVETCLDYYYPPPVPSYVRLPDGD